MIEESFTNFLKTEEGSARLGTSVPGVFILKLSTCRFSPIRLMVEFDSVDEKKNPRRWRGPILRSSTEMEEVIPLYQFKKHPKLLNMLDSTSPRGEATKRRQEEELIEL